MIVVYGQNGLEEDALVLFAEMLSQKVRPDDITFSRVISSCAKLASLYHGQIAHGKAVHMGVDGDLLVCSSLIDMYSKSGQPTDAWIVFNTMPMKNVVSWNSIILGYTQNGKDLQALALYEEMLQENMKPTNTTFIGVLTACIHAGLSERGKKYFQSITEVHEMKPFLDHYACMITLLGRFGSIDRALDLVKCMPCEPNCRIWSALLAACKMKGDVENGEKAARHLFEMDPHNAEPYINLSSMYTACSRWEDVAKTRSLMQSNQVKKFSAYSWIDTDGKVHKFTADDKTHPESEVIYLELYRLLRRLEEAGFSVDKSLVLRRVEEDQKFLSIYYHSEKLALAFALVRKPHGMAAIRIIKNVRICSDCHLFMKFASQIIGRAIILRDSNRFHHFVGGQCFCKDYWRFQRIFGGYNLQVKT